MNLITTTTNILSTAEMRESCMAKLVYLIPSSTEEIGWSRPAGPASTSRAPCFTKTRKLPVIWHLWWAQERWVSLCDGWWKEQFIHRYTVCNMHFIFKMLINYLFFCKTLLIDSPSSIKYTEYLNTVMLYTRREVWSRFLFFPLHE